jgi:hypothetical protein
MRKLRSRSALSVALTVSLVTQAVAVETELNEVRLQPLLNEYAHPSCTLLVPGGRYGIKNIEQYKSHER